MPSIKRERDAPSSSSSESKGSKLHSNYSVKDELDSDDDDTKPDVRGSPNKKPKKVSGSAAGRGSGDGKGNGKGKSGGKGKGSKEVRLAPTHCYLRYIALTPLAICASRGTIFSR